MRTGRPLVTLKAALTLDGKIAAPEDNTGWITSVRARAHVQQIRHHSDAILTGIGTVLADDCLLTDRTGLERSRPLLRIVADSTLRVPLDSRIVASAAGDVAILTTSAAPEERRRALEYRGVRVLVFDGPGGRADLQKLVEYLAGEQYRSLMIESGSKLNWAALEAGIVDKIFFYYAPKILGGLQSLPVAGGAGRLRRTDAIQFERVKLHSIPPGRVRRGSLPGEIDVFTGIVEELGTIAKAGARMNVQCSKVLEDTREGSSIAVNGVCLTATNVDANGILVRPVARNSCAHQSGRSARRIARKPGTSRRASAIA